MDTYVRTSRSNCGIVAGRFVETGSYKIDAVLAELEQTTLRDDRFIVSTSLQNRFLTSINNIKKELNEVRGVNVNARTIISANSLKLSAAHRQARLRFMREHLNLTEDQWAEVIVHR
ncbi:unnamed protein product [Euphydryas editha]|uniref:Uncharacterized protein n=1 Tax=Euphydryas editha TaxID=104508 RepID=A0AAU9UXV2_EUPED|nr:unnamed protein product [Euphydryas editha]